MAQNPGYFAIHFHPKSERKEVIWNKNLEEVILGRCVKKARENFIGVSNEATVSRNHAKLSWDFKNQSWNLEVMHKSGIYSHGKHYKQDETLPLPMDKVTPIALGARVTFGTRFYFFPPQKPFVLQTNEIKQEKLNGNEIKQENNTIPPEVEEL